MKVNDAIIGMIVLVLAVFLFVTAETFISMPGVPYGPKLFPQVVSTIMGGAGLVLCLSGLRSLPTSPWIVLDDWARKPRTYLILFSIAGSVVFYVIAAPTLGFLLTSATMLIVLLSIIRGRKNLPQSIVISIIFPGLIFTIFFYFLRVQLPVGLLEHYLLGYS